MCISYIPEEPGVAERESRRAAEGFTAEGLRLSRATWDYFWDPQRKHFKTLKKTPETVNAGGWYGYLLWPSVVAIEALLEAEVASPGSFTAEIEAALEALQGFYSTEYGAYTAWLAFPGNNDIYYDDNAQVAIALLKAYSIPTVRSEVYLDRARVIVDFLFSGWDEANGGGMRWHVGKPIRNAISTSLTAVAVLTLAGTNPQASPSTNGGNGGGDNGSRNGGLITFGRTCLQWVFDELQLDSGLIKDGVDGGPTYTYNTGVPLIALSLLQELSPTPDLPAKAETLAAAAVDRSKSLFDLSVVSDQVRYWWDFTFFLQLLAEGLAAYVHTFGSLQPDTARRVNLELRREADYLRTHVLDNSDGLYWRSLRLYTISEEKFATYRRLTGDTVRLPDYNNEERLDDDASRELPVGQRELCKTLLGSGGAARSLLLVGRCLLRD